MNSLIIAADASNIVTLLQIFLAGLLDVQVAFEERLLLLKVFFGGGTAFKGCVKTGALFAPTSSS